MKVFLLLTLLLYASLSIADSQVSEILSNKTLWTDDHNSSVQLKDFFLKEKLVVVTMAFSVCTKTCPMTFRILKEIEGELNKHHKSAEFVIVSLDAKNDTPERTAHMRLQHDLTGKNWHFLRGSVEETKSISKLLGVNAFDLDDHIIHNFRILVLKADGSIAHTFDWNHRSVKGIFGK